MDPNLVFEALQHSVGKTQQEIEFAEKYLQQVKYCEGYIQTLLLVGCDEKVTLFVRQAALVYLRSTVRELWRKKEGGMSELDKSTLKESILDGLIKCTESPNKQLTDTISYIAETDFPTPWDSFFKDLWTRLKNPSDASNLFGSLLALKSLVRNFEFLQGKDRIPLEYMIEDTFPVLANLTKNFLLNYNDQVDNMLRIIVKIFYKAINMLLPKYLLNEEVLKSWLFNIQGILERPFPQGMETKTGNERILERWEMSSAWSNKKWCARILNRFLNKYCDRTTCKDENKVFPEIFLSFYSNHFFETLLKLLSALKNYYIHPKFRFFALKYMINSLNFPEIYNCITTNFENIIYDVIIPALLLTVQDEEDWIHNPIEFLRREEDYLDLSQNSKLAAESLLLKMYEKKLFSTAEGELVLYRLFEYSGNVLLNNIDLRNNTSADLRMKEVVLNVLGILNELILSKKEYESQMQSLFEKFIIPEFGSIQGPLRYRLCWLFGSYSRIDFGKVETILTLTEGLYGSLCQGELPVRVRAAISLNSIFENDKAHEYIIPFLDKILMSYINLIDTIENERLIKAFGGIIEKFAEYISPYAIDLVKYLTNIFYKTDQESLQSALLNEIQEKEAVAACFLSSIARIFDPNLPRNIIYELEKLLLPTLMYILKNEQSNYISLGLRILDKLLLYLDTLSEDIWMFYPILNYLIVGYPENSGINVQEKLQREFKFLEAVHFNGRGEEYVQEITPCFQKFIQKDKGMLFNARDPSYNLTYLELLFLSVEKVYEICYDCENDTDMVLITTVYIALIENHQPLSHEIMACLIDKVIVNIPHVKSIAMEKMLLQIVAVCLWANTGFTLQYLEQKNATEYVFKRWIIRIPDFRHSFEFKRIMIGLSSLLRVDVAQLPQILLASLKGFLNQIINLTTVVTEMRASRLTTFSINNLKAFSSDQSDDFQNQGKNDEYSEEDDEWIQDYEISELVSSLEEYSSPLIQTCEILYFKESLEMLKQNQNPAFEELMSTVNNNDVIMLQNNFEKALSNVNQQ